MINIIRLTRYFNIVKTKSEIEDEINKKKAKTFELVVINIKNKNKIIN